MKSDINPPDIGECKKCGKAVKNGAVLCFRCISVFRKIAADTQSLHDAYEDRQKEETTNEELDGLDENDYEYQQELPFCGNARQLPHD